MSTDTDREDEAWLAALRGRPPADADPMVNAQAEAVRRAIVEGRQAEADTVPDAAELQRLMFRMRREGLLDAGRPAWRLPLALAATIVLGVAIGVQLQGDGYFGNTPDETVRGGPEQQQITVADVPATAARIAEALRGIGADVAVIESAGGVVEVAATIPADKRAEAVARLTPFGLKMPARSGAWRVEIRLERKAP